MKVWMGLGLLAVVLAGCAGEGDVASDSNDVVIGTSDLANEVAVFGDRLEFDASAATKLEASLAKVGGSEPVYLVGGRQANAVAADGTVKSGLRNPTGYLRRALSWQKTDSGKIVVKTAVATLSEALEEVKKNGFLDLQPRSNGEDVDDGFGNVDRTWTHSFGPSQGFAVVDLSGKELWKKSIPGGSAQVVLTKGRLNLRPTVETHLRIDRFRPQRARIAIIADIDADLEVEASAASAWNERRDGRLFEKSFGATVGKMPVTLNLEVKWDCAVRTSGKATATVPWSTTGRFRVGTEWAGRLNGFAEPNFTFAPMKPSIAADVPLSSECHVIPVLRARAFDAAEGPDATIDLSANLVADGFATSGGAQANAVVMAGAELRLAGSLRPFGIDAGDISIDPKIVEKEIYSGAVTLGRP